MYILDNDERLRRFLRLLGVAMIFVLAIVVVVAVAVIWRGDDIGHVFETLFGGRGHLGAVGR